MILSVNTSYYPKQNYFFFVMEAKCVSFEVRIFKYYLDGMALKFRPNIDLQVLNKHFTVMQPYQC